MRHRRERLHPAMGRWSLYHLPVICNLNGQMAGELLDQAADVGMVRMLDADRTGANLAPVTIDRIGSRLLRRVRLVLPVSLDAHPVGRNEISRKLRRRQFKRTLA